MGRSGMGMCVSGSPLLGPNAGFLHVSEMASHLLEPRFQAQGAGKGAAAAWAYLGNDRGRTS